MNYSLITLGCSVLEGIIFSIFLTKILKKSSSKIFETKQELDLQTQERERYKEKIDKIFDELIPFEQLKEAVIDYKSFSDALQAEKGRISISEAEVDIIETRLRELEEIERELASSKLETEEESKILAKKEQELLNKNNSLKQKVQETQVEIENILEHIEISMQLKAEIDRIQAELLSTQSKTDEILSQIHLSNEQYIKFKERYDALDIEYAQLFEKFGQVDQENK